MNKTWKFLSSWGHFAFLAFAVIYAMNSQFLVAGVMATVFFLSEASKRIETNNHA